MPPKMPAFQKPSAPAPKSKKSVPISKKSDGATTPTFAEGEITETVQERLRIELEEQKKTLAIKQEELIQLKDEVTANITEPTIQRKAIESKLATTEEDLAIRIESMQALEISIEAMTKDIEEIQVKKQEAEGRLHEKRDVLNIELKIFIELEMLINEIDAEIQQIYENYQNLINEKELERIRIMNDPNLTAEEKEHQLDQLQEELAELREECAVVMSELAIKQDEWQKNSKAYAEQLENSLKIVNEKFNEELEALERQKIGATPSEMLRIDAKIAELSKTHEENVSLIEHALVRKEYYTDQYGRYFFNDDGIKVYQRYSNASQFIMDADGNMVKIVDAVPEVEKGGSIQAPSEASITTLQRKQKEDQEYIKRELGTPLRLALAKITVLQPTDPINYLANFLLEYRYNEVMNIKKESELEALLTERANLKEQNRKHKLIKQQQAVNPKKTERPMFPHCTTCDQILPKNI